jgi:hypothetical protein
MGQQFVRYRSFISDNIRWEGFTFRPDDIVITTPAKCGTTWTQMICALLIFQKTEFDQPLDRLSPWFDMLTRDADDVLARVEAQTHRRFIKTHTPLDGLPWDERVTYIGVGRDPRDVALSFDHHMDNMDITALVNARAGAVGLDDLAEFFPEGPPVRHEREIDRFWAWVDLDDVTSTSGLKPTLHHLATLWEVRHRPNVVLLHYDDLKDDLDGQMRMVADRLGIVVPDERWPELVAAASFDHMRARASEVAPEIDNTLWHSNEQFFHRGTSGQWRSLLDESDLRRYFARVAEVAEADVAAWAHRTPIAV